MSEHNSYFVPLSTPITTVSSQEYRDAMSKFAGAVHIVTTDGDHGLRGVTISASCSLSDNPATVLVCLIRSHADNRFFIENKRFAINTLGGHHKDLSDVFAGKEGLSQEQRFEKSQWQVLKTGSPVLCDALATFDCELVGWHEHNTHYVLIGEVVAIKQSKAENALLYLNRNYHTLDL